MLLVASMTGALLAGCGSGETASTDASADAAADTNTAAAGTETAADAAATDGEAVTLKWAIWDQETTPYWNALKEAYEAANPNVTIEMVDLGSTDYMTVLATELSGSGSDFDVVTIKDVPGYATLVQKNTLESLDDYITDAGINLADFNGITDQVTVDGSLYELPFRSDYWLIYYNKDVQRYDDGRLRCTGKTADRYHLRFPGIRMPLSHMEIRSRTVRNPGWKTLYPGRQLRLDDSVL